MEIISSVHFHMQMELYIKLKIVKILLVLSEDNENIQKENFFFFFGIPSDANSNLVWDSDEHATYYLIYLDGNRKTIFSLNSFIVFVFQVLQVVL
jgi:hypothetical protein